MATPDLDLSVLWDLRWVVSVLALVPLAVLLVGCVTPQPRTVSSNTQDFDDTMARIEEHRAKDRARLEALKRTIEELTPKVAEERAEDNRLYKVYTVAVTRGEEDAKRKDKACRDAWFHKNIGTLANCNAWVTFITHKQEMDEYLAWNKVHWQLLTNASELKSAEQSLHLSRVLAAGGSIYTGSYTAPGGSTTTCTTIINPALNNTETTCQ